MAKAKTEKTRCNGQWTEAKYKSFIVSALRRASTRWAPKHKCLKDCKTGRNQYVCSECKKTVGHKMIKADHIAPVVGMDGWRGWDVFINRLFVEAHGYRALCKDCHAAITKSQNAIRKEIAAIQNQHPIPTPVCMASPMHYAVEKSEHTR